MKTAQQIKRKIQSTNSTSQITKAMEMVSASKMKKSQEAALMARPYTKAALHILENVSESVGSEKHVLLKKRKVENLCLFVVTSDKGLCGGLNSSVLRSAEKTISENKDKHISIVTVGRKAESYFKRRNNNVIAVFNKIGDSVELRETLPIAKLLMDDFTDKKFDAVIAIYTNFVSTLRQCTEVKNILPVTKKSVEKTVEEIGDMTTIEDEDKNGNNTEYKFEPSPEKVLRNLLPSLIEIQIYHIILESNASEHSARMVAMKNATDSAVEMLEELNLTYNYIRQQKITQEMSEITAGVIAQES